MGVDRKKMQNLQVVKVLAEQNLILVELYLDAEFRFEFDPLTSIELTLEHRKLEVLSVSAKYPVDLPQSLGIADVVESVA